MITLAFLVISALPVTPLQTGDVQSAAVFELNVNLDEKNAAFCKTILAGDPWCAKAGRRYELNPKERSRILSLLNGAGAFTAKAKCTKPRHAVLFQTTKGPRAFDISFDPCDADIATAAGGAWREYRRRGGRRDRLMPDFLVAAHAAARCDRLITRDRGFARRYFRSLNVVDPSSARLRA